MSTSVIGQAKAAMNHHMAILQSRLAKRTAERDDALARISDAENRAAMAERSARDTSADRSQWRDRALKAEVALASLNV